MEPINNDYCKEVSMEKVKEVFYWRCPECGEEQEVLSSFFAADCVSGEKCHRCGKRVSCIHPASPKSEKTGTVAAYVKE